MIFVIERLLIKSIVKKGENLTQKLISLLGRVENLVGKKEND